MTKHFHVILWAPLIFCALFLIVWINWYSNEVIEFEHFVLEKQLNYATDSAVDAMLVDTDIDPDYTNGAFIQVDPQMAKEDIAHTLSLDFGYTATDTSANKVLLDNVKVLVVAGYDGYYYFTQQFTDSKGTYELVQSPKIPYFYTANNGTQYCLTLNPDYGYYADANAAGEIDLHNKDYYPPTVRPSNSVQSAAINDAVADTINWCLYNSLSHGLTQKVKVPNTANNLRQYQVIDTPTCICVATGNYQSKSSAVIADGLAGSKVTQNDTVVAYTITGDVQVHLDDTTLGTLPKGNWYAYASWWNAHKPVSTTGLDNPKVYQSAYDAARNGYNSMVLLFEN